jgi:predicted phage-related endonuclease
MKKLLVKVVVLVMLFSSSLFINGVFGAFLETNSTNTFEKNKEKEIRISIPSECASFQGQIFVTNFSTTAMLSEYPTKTLAKNDANGIFIIYGINQDLLTGYNLVIKGLVANDNIAKVEIRNCLGATKDAGAVQIDDFIISMKSFYDINEDGVFDVKDILELIKILFETATIKITEIQQLINALVANY